MEKKKNGPTLFIITWLNYSLIRIRERNSRPVNVYGCINLQNLNIKLAKLQSAAPISYVYPVNGQMHKHIIINCPKIPAYYACSIIFSPAISCIVHTQLYTCAKSAVQNT